MRNTNERATRDGAGKNVSDVETKTRGTANAEPRIRKENRTMSKKNKKSGRVGASKKASKKIEAVEVKVATEAQATDKIAAEDKAAVEAVLGKEPKAKGKKAPKEQPVAGEQTVKVRKKTERKDGTMSGLDAAAKILADAKKPMDCKAIVEKALASGMWKTKGKTPAATVYAAIIREIAKKGETSRFKKSGRGTFVSQE